MLQNLKRLLLHSLWILWIAMQRISHALQIAVSPNRQLLLGKKSCASFVVILDLDTPLIPWSATSSVWFLRLKRQSFESWDWLAPCVQQCFHRRDGRVGLVELHAVFDNVPIVFNKRVICLRISFIYSCKLLSDEVSLCAEAWACGAGTLWWTFSLLRACWNSVRKLVAQSWRSAWACKRAWFAEFVT